MDINTISRIFKETAYSRTGGSPEELKIAQYIQAECSRFGCEAVLESFPVDMATIHTAKLWIDGEEVICEGYLNAGSATVEAPLYYLRDTLPFSLAGCNGKIVLLDLNLGTWLYQDLLANGAVGFISYNGNAYTDSNIYQKELRSYVSKGQKMPGVTINAKDALRIVQNGAKTAKIQLEQTEYTADSHNVILDLPGEIDQYILLSAHYDSTPLSQGAYDNMSGAIGLLSMAETFSKKPHRYGIRFLWCGSEERGLLGSKEYCKCHEPELERIVLNINLDMIGCAMGSFNICCTTEEKAVGYIEYMASETGFGTVVRQDIRSSDSTPFADCGIPAVSFARYSPPSIVSIHNCHDTMDVMSPRQMAADIAFICAFLDRMANAVYCPIARQIPEKLKEKLDVYLARKRP